MSLATILIILLILILIGVVPGWNHSANWGYSPVTAVVLVLLIVLLLSWQKMI